jgi:hypothetical protein
MARTTLRLDDSQMVRLKNLARAQGRTMTDLINEFIAEGLAARTAPKSEQALDLPVFDMVGPESTWPIAKHLKGSWNRTQWRSSSTPIFSSMP